MLAGSRIMGRRSYAKTSNVITSKLENGIKVVSSTIPCHFNAVGCYIDAGSRYETPLTTGSSHVLDRLAFKATTKFTQEQMETGLLALGGNYSCQSSRETMMYQGSTFKGDFEKLTEYIAQTVNEPVIGPAQISEQIENIKFELGELNQKPELILPELGHQVAFKDQLGNPLVCPEDRLSLITPAQIYQFRHDVYQPQRMTLSFIGVEHEQSLELAAKYWGHLSETNPGPERIKSIYSGGEKCIPLAKQIGYIPVFEYLQVFYRGVGINDPDVYAASVLQVLLGGGSSFSAGGPGKGMFSRLFTEVLNKYGFVESCVSANLPYSDDGLFGITCGVVPGAAKYAAYVVGSQLALVATPNELKVEEVERAKKQLCSQLVMNLESRMVELEDSGRQVSLNGHKIPVQDMIAEIEKLGPRDLERVAYRMLTSSPPSIVIQGEREQFGDVAKVLKDFGLGSS